MNDVFGFASFQRKKPQEAAPLSQFQARDGTSLSYRYYESSVQGKAILLLHGSGTHGNYLHPFAKFLSAEGAVYVPNLRGHYASGETRGHCAYVGQLEDDLYDLIDHFQLQDKEICLIGHSSGGGLAIRMAGGPYGKLIKKFVLLSPAIPTAPTMRDGTAGGWASISLPKIIFISALNRFGIKCLNHLPVVRFNKPQQYCDGTETLSYSFNLNVSYHPRLPFALDIAALKGRSLTIIGSDDEANDPSEFSKIMQGEPVQIIEKANHLNIVRHPAMMDLAISWIKK